MEREMEEMVAMEGSGGGNSSNEGIGIPDLARRLRESSEKGRVLSPIRRVVSGNPSRRRNTTESLALREELILETDFYNWNRVKLRYCDGASIAGDGEYHSGITSLYFRGQRIWEAIISDLLQKGLSSANKVKISNSIFSSLNKFLKVMRDVSGNYTMRKFVEDLLALQQE
ncbi:hypothetical protein QJS10_CPB13g00427 [Acorus calamus]|uniref:Pectin acetylesterase n=1 Tax=Acorus calamus TaxID=4465 RepID=A0AAV9DID4_ACOCL|nr:hypothetical protein QJS10_CPB13g00427 [Acorus calamus]